jgi:hypothetical protein
MPDYCRRAAREAMSVRLDVNGMMADAVDQADIARAEVEMLARRTAEESKRFAYGLVGRKGFQTQRAEMEARWTRRHSACVL